MNWNRVEGTIIWALALVVVVGVVGGANDVTWIKAVILYSLAW